MIKTLLAFVVSVFSIVPFSFAQNLDAFPAVTAEDKHRIGNFEITAPGVESSIYAQVHADIENRKFQPTTPFVTEKNTKQVVYDVFVPKDYSKDESYGLLVWISPIENGRVPKHYRSVLTKHKLLGIGTHKSGNDPPTVFRASYAIQAMTMMKQRYISAGV